MQWAEALALFLRAADTLGLVSRKSLWGQFWSSHQRFFKYLCISAKVRRLVELAKAELEQGKVSPALSPFFHLALLSLRNWAGFVALNLKC